MNKSKIAMVGLALCMPLLHGCLPAVVAGGGAAVLMAEDRRSTGTIIDDQTLEAKVRKRINEKNEDQVHVDVGSFNRFVLVIGEVPTQQMKDDIGAIALGVEHVRNVQNELMISPYPSASTRASDAYLTSKVK